MDKSEQENVLPWRHYEDREKEETMVKINNSNETQNDNNELHMYDSVEMQDDGSFFF